MICTLSLITALLFFAQNEDVPATENDTPPAAEEEVSIDPLEALDKIKAAVKSDSDIVILDAVEVCANVKDKKVIIELSKLLKHKSADVRLAVIEALRFNEHEESFNRLLKFGKDKRLKQDSELLTEYIYALGQKADKKAEKIITDGLIMTGAVDKEILIAKIYSLGRIRQVDSIETLLKFSQSATRGGGRRGGGGRTPKLRIEIQTSLTVLTGVELGDNLLDWTSWWSDNKRKFKMSKTEGEISNRKLQAKWQALWMTEEQKAKALQDFKDEKEKQDKEGKDDGLIDF